MATTQIVLPYTMPLSLQRQSAQVAAAQEVALAVAPDLIPLSVDSKVATVTGGLLRLEVTLTPLGPEFDAMFPTEQAVRDTMVSLFAQQLEFQLACPVTSLDPVIT